MPNFSNITLAGHLGRDAELKNVGDSTVCEFSVAVTKKQRGNESTAWYRCTIWGSRGEALAPKLEKGTAVIVSGEFVPREYKGKKDELRTSLDVRVDQLGFAGAKPAKAEAPPQKSAAGYDDSSDVPF